MEFKFITITVDTILGENENFDKVFFEYLEEYSIAHKILEKDTDREWPRVEYTSGPIALTNMLKERFGMEQSEIDDLYPEIKENRNV